jgi:hypothetical protein
MPHDPTSALPEPAGEAAHPEVALTATQRAILEALCRPCRGESRYATPATNGEIAKEVFLSVDAVKAHLRALYRKFGVGPLPHNQKRARLVELVLESGVLTGERPAAPERAARSGDGPTPPAAPTGGGNRRWRLPLLAALLVAAVALAAVALIDGGSAEEGPSRAEYSAAVRAECAAATDQLSLFRTERLNRATTAQRAQAYLFLIDGLRERVETLREPDGPMAALDRFRQGLGRAAELTGEVAQGPPPPGSRRNAIVVAELTVAAGQVQAGAVAYGLGPACSEVGDLIARSARNAAGQ